MSEKHDDNLDRVWDIIEKVGVTMLTTQFPGGLRARPLEAQGVTPSFDYNRKCLYRRANSQDARLKTAWAWAIRVCYFTVLSPEHSL
jgi:hypothetical protein